MHPSIDYYFSLVSPWAYIGHATFMDLTQRHSLDVNFRPVRSLQYCRNRRPSAQQARASAAALSNYGIAALAREARCGLNIHPKFWPFSVETADHLTVTIVELGANPDQFLRKAFLGVWADEISLPTSKRSLCSPIASDSRHKNCLPTPRATALKRGTRRILKRPEIDAFGSPCYVLNGEVFWGQDRIELLDDALTSGRKAYRNDT